QVFHRTCDQGIVAVVSDSSWLRALAEGAPNARGSPSAPGNSPLLRGTWDTSLGSSARKARAIVLGGNTRPLAWHTFGGPTGIPFKLQSFTGIYCEFPSRSRDILGLFRSIL